MEPDAGAATTRILAEFIAGQSWDSLPAEARELAGRAIADCVGGALAGATEEAGRAVTEFARAEPGNVPVWGSGLRSSERAAALANGTMAHAHDIDDTNESMRGHASAPVVPAIFAVAANAGVDGKAIIAAHVVGVEIEAKLGLAVNMEHYERGWHTTCTLGTMGAAAAVANLLRLDAERSARALALAASMASGLRANFGTMTKPLHCGLAAQNGVLAARLAAGGMSANPDILDAKEGFFDLFCGTDNVAAGRAVTCLGAPYDVVEPGIVIKIYPTCSLTHQAVDIVLEGMESGAIDPSRVRQINCGIGYRRLSTLPYDRPRTGLEAKFSMEYSLAAALHYGRVTFAEFTDEAVNAPEIRALYPKMNVYTHPDLQTRESLVDDFADVEVVHEDGSVYRKRLHKPRGHPANPLGWAEIEAKFRACAGPVVGEDAAAATWSRLRRLENLDASEIAALF